MALGEKSKPQWPLGMSRPEKAGLFGTIARWLR
jgi:hypothetical protein